MRDNLAVIDQGRCVSCGICSNVCPAGAIRSTVPSIRESVKGGQKIFYEYGRGFGFRGSSPSWPYIGRGRGGLPRCQHPGLYGRAAAYPAPGGIAYPTSPTPENELSFLKSQADMIKQEMAEIERRIQELEKKN